MSYWFMRTLSIILSLSVNMQILNRSCVKRIGTLGYSFESIQSQTHLPDKAASLNVSQSQLNGPETMSSATSPHSEKDMMMINPSLLAEQASSSKRGSFNSTLPRCEGERTSSWTQCRPTTATKKRHGFSVSLMGDAYRY